MILDFIASAQSRRGAVMMSNSVFVALPSTISINVLRIYHQPKSLLIKDMVEDAYRSDWTDMDLHLEKEWARFAKDGLGYDQVTRWPLDASVIHEGESDSDHHDPSCPKSNAPKLMIGSLAVGLRVHELGETSQVGKPVQPDLVVALNAAQQQ